MARTPKQAADLQLADDPRLEPAKGPPGTSDVRSFILLLGDFGTVPRGWIAAARHQLADQLLDSGKARIATEPDLAAFGRDPVEI